MSTQNTHSVSKVDDCRVIDLKVIPNENGKLAVMENGTGLPFAINRMFFLFDVPAGAYRGGHSHYEMEELILAMTGSFDVVLNDGHDERVVRLDRPDKALYIRAGIWRELKNFTSGAVCAVLASTLFEESDYVRDFETFRSLTRDKSWTKR